MFLAFLPLGGIFPPSPNLPRVMDWAGDADGHTNKAYGCCLMFFLLVLHTHTHTHTRSRTVKNALLATDCASRVRRIARLLSPHALLRGEGEIARKSEREGETLPQKAVCLIVFLSCNTAQRMFHRSGQNLFRDACIAAAISLRYFLSLPPSFSSFFLLLPSRSLTELHASILVRVSGVTLCTPKNEVYF